MKRATLEMVQTRLGEFVKSSVKQPILILRDGEPVAMLVGIGASEKRTPAKLRDVLQKAWREYEEHGGVPHDQFWDELGKEKVPRRKKRTGS